MLIFKKPDDHLSHLVEQITEVSREAPELLGTCLWLIASSHWIPALLRRYEPSEAEYSAVGEIAEGLLQEMVREARQRDRQHHVAIAAAKSGLLPQSQ